MKFACGLRPIQEWEFGLLSTLHVTIHRQKNNEEIKINHATNNG